MLLSESSTPFFTTEPKWLLSQTCDTQNPWHMSQHSWASHCPGYLPPRIQRTLISLCPRPARIQPKRPPCGDWGHSPLLQWAPVAASSQDHGLDPSLPSPAPGQQPPLPSPVSQLAPTTFPHLDLPRPAWPQPPRPPPARSLASWVHARALRPGEIGAIQSWRLPWAYARSLARSRTLRSSASLCWPSEALPRSPRTRCWISCGPWSTTCVCSFPMPATLWAMPTSIEPLRTVFSGGGRLVHTCP